MKYAHKVLLIWFCTIFALPVGSRIFSKWGILTLLGAGIVFALLMILLTFFFEIGIEKRNKK